MKQVSTTWALCATLVAAAFAVTGPGASAQTMNSLTGAPEAASVAAAPAPTTSAKKTATARMIDEALQRSVARHEKFLLDGTPEEVGSEEPFTYDPNKQTFTAAQQ